MFRRKKYRRFQFRYADCSQLRLETLEDRVLLSSVQVFASGSTGEETFDLLVNDEVVESFQLIAVEQEVFQFDTFDQIAVEDLKISFTNDFFDAVAGVDRNLIVEKIVVDGVTYETEHPSTFSTGSWTADGLSPGTWETEYLHAGGFFQYSADAAQSMIEVVASGATGDEEFLIDVNGEVIGTFQVSQDDQTFFVLRGGVIDPDFDIVRVEFLNDLFVPEEGIDRDLFVDRLIINGVSYETDNDTTYSTGTWVGEGIPTVGFLSSNTLNVTGYFEYLAATDIVIRASGDEGTEQIELQIGEETVASFDLTTTFSEFTYRHFARLTPDLIRIVFSGDEYDPEIGLDKNVNIDWIEIRGVRVETEADTVFSNATWTTDDSGVLPGFGRGSTLHQDGFFQYGFALKPDVFSIPEDSIDVPLAVFANDNVVGSISIEVVTSPDHGAFQIVDGELFYTPDADFDGPDQLTYRQAGSSAPAVTVDINVRQSHQQPQTLIDPRVAPELTPSGKSLVVEKFVKIPLGENGKQPRLNGLVTSGDRTFAFTDGGVDGEGRIYEFVTDEAGKPAAELFLDVGAAVLENTGQLISNFSPLYGLRAVAFHPDFATNGKLYVAFTAPRPDDPSVSTYLSTPENPVTIESVVGEFTYDFVTGEIDTQSYRELFRVGMRTLDHPISGMTFNSLAQPSDEDYGLLYIGHGDGSEQSAIAGDGQDGDALGKVLRVNPLQTEDSEFTAPETNPFFGIEDYPDEVYAVGFRNPHNLTFARDSEGEVHLIVTDIGRDNVEEINIVVSGGNYGWADREGIFQHIRELGQINGNITTLPDNEAENGFIFPVAIVGHDGTPGDFFVGQAIAGGHVINNGSNELHGQFILAEFATDGRAYHIDFAEALQQVTLLDADDPERDSPDELTWLTPKELTILFDHDNDDSTTPLVRDSLKDVFDDEPDFVTILSAGKVRADLRFGQGANGELFIVNKRNGWVYLASNTVAPPDVA